MSEAEIPVKVIRILLELIKFRGNFNRNVRIALHSTKSLVKSTALFFPRKVSRENIYLFTYERHFLLL